MKTGKEETRRLSSLEHSDPERVDVSQGIPERRL